MVFYDGIKLGLDVDAVVGDGSIGCIQLDILNTVSNAAQSQRLLDIGVNLAV